MNDELQMFREMPPETVLELVWKNLPISVLPYQHFLRNNIISF